VNYWNDTDFMQWHKRVILKERILEETSAWLLKLTATDKFLHLLGLSLTLSMGVSHVAILVYSPESKDYRVKMSFGIKKIPTALVKLDGSNALVHDLSTIKNHTQKLSSHAQQVLNYFHAKMCFPIFVREHFLGILLIGPKIDEQPYEMEGISFFQTLANEIGVEMEKESYYQESLTDSLTGLFNRNHLKGVMGSLDKDLNKTNGCVAIALIDVDHFKKINDQYGHSCGDLILQVIADKMRKNVRANDPCIRYGGEEFCIIFSDLIRRDGTRVANDSEQFVQAVQKVVERLKQEISENTIIYRNQEIHVTVSIGLVFCKGREQNFNTQQLIDEADKLLYAAKEGGRNRIEVSVRQ
jgi:diguanylate cyclase (GGDEF)-like protein